MKNIYTTETGIIYKIISYKKALTINKEVLIVDVNGKLKYITSWNEILEAKKEGLKLAIIVKM